jgi:hypothetical protein
LTLSGGSKGYGFVWCVIPLLSSQAPFYCCSVAEQAQYCATTSDPPLSLLCNGFMDEADQICARTEMQDLYYKSCPSIWCFRFCKCILSDFLVSIFPQGACRMLRPRRRLQLLTKKCQIQSLLQSARPAGAPMLIGPMMVQHHRSVTSSR